MPAEFLSNPTNIYTNDFLFNLSSFQSVSVWNSFILRAVISKPWAIHLLLSVYVWWMVNRFFLVRRWVIVGAGFVLFHYNTYAHSILLSCINYTGDCKYSEAHNIPCIMFNIHMFPASSSIQIHIIHVHEFSIIGKKKKCLLILFRFSQKQAKCHFFSTPPPFVSAHTKYACQRHIRCVRRFSYT